MPPARHDNDILAEILKSFDNGTMKVDMTTFAAKMGHSNVKSASNLFSRMKLRYSLKVERITLPASGDSTGRMMSAGRGTGITTQANQDLSDTEDFSGAEY